MLKILPLFTVSCFLFPAGTLTTVGQATSQSVCDIGSRRELLVDHYLIDRLEGLTLKLQQPVRREVALVHDEPWEGNVSAYHTVF